MTKLYKQKKEIKSLMLTQVDREKERDRRGHVSIMSQC